MADLVIVKAPLRAGPERVRFGDVLVSKLPGIGRYTAGPRVEDAILKRARLSGKGIASIANILGEHDQDPATVGITMEQYLGLISGISEAKGLKRPAISLKPTQFGLDHTLEKRARADESEVEERMLSIARRAADDGIFVWYDMENHNTTDFTLGLYRKSLSLGLAGGVALQANMRRSHDDLQDLLTLSRRLPSRVHVRLIRGIYNEPAKIAYQGRTEMHASFARLIKAAFEEGKLAVSVGTHHPDQIIRTLDMSRRFAGKLYDVQFLLGAAARLPAFLSKIGIECAYYVPAGPRFLDYGLRRLKENPGGLLGLFAAPLFETMNVWRVKDYLDGKLRVEQDSDGLDIVKK